eukprot:2167296-Amphidinium_carterae.1
MILWPNAPKSPKSTKERDIVGVIYTTMGTRTMTETKIYKTLTGVKSSAADSSKGVSSMPSQGEYRLGSGGGGGGDDEDDDDEKETRSS